MSKFEISEKESQFLNLLEQIVTDGVARGIKRGLNKLKMRKD